MFYTSRKPDVTRTYPNGAVGYMTPMPFSSWAAWKNVPCEDGKRRAVYAVSDADTFFSVPAKVTVRKNGKRYTVAGFVSFTNDPEGPIFTAYSYRKNGAILKG